MKAKDVLALLKITRVTLMNYVKDGKIKANKIGNGYYNYDDQSVYDFIGFNNKVNVIYSRSSSIKNKVFVEKQIKHINDFCSKNNFVVSKIFTDFSSSISIDREQLNSLLDDVFNNKIDKIFITHKDSISSVSFDSLEKIFKKFGATIIIVPDFDSTNNEIFDDLSSLMTFFSNKSIQAKNTKK